MVVWMGTAETISKGDTCYEGELSIRINPPSLHILDMFLTIPAIHCTLTPCQSRPEINLILTVKQKTSDPILEQRDVSTVLPALFPCADIKIRGRCTFVHVLGCSRSSSSWRHPRRPNHSTTPGLYRRLNYSVNMSFCPPPNHPVTSSLPRRPRHG